MNRSISTSNKYENMKSISLFEDTQLRKPTIQLNAVVLKCMMVALLIPIFGHTQTRVITADIGVNQYSTGYKNKNFAYRSYSEDRFGTGIISLSLLRAHGKKRRSLEVSVLRRSLVINTFSGGHAGGGSHEIDMDLTYMNLSGFVGSRFMKTMPLFIDIGGYIGIPLDRNAVDNYSIFVSPPFDMNNGSGTNTDPNEYLAKIELGAILKTGFQFKVSEKIALSLTLRLHCGFGGKAKFNAVAFDRLAMLGIGRILDGK